MTKLQYLNALNKGQHRYRDCSDSVKRTLDSCIKANTGVVLRTRDHEYRPRRYTGQPLCSHNVYRVTEAVRPAGIPDDIHRRYS